MADLAMKRLFKAAQREPQDDEALEVGLAREISRLRAQVEDLRMHAEQDACEIERLCVDVLALVNAVHFLLAGRAPTEDLAEVLARCEGVGRGDALGGLVALSEDAGLYAAQEADRG